MKKLFISHASEDKDDFVRPLAEALSKEFEVWYDEYQLVTGCSLLEEINKGLAECDFGVVILSPNFFLKNWPQLELNGLFALEQKNRKVILPIWKDVNKADILKYSPILADRKASLAKDGIIKVVDELQKAVSFFERGRAIEIPSEGLNKLSSKLLKNKERNRSEELVASVNGVFWAKKLASKTIEILYNHANSLNSLVGYEDLVIESPVNTSNMDSITIFVRKLYLHLEYYNDCINSARNARLSVNIGKLPYGHYVGYTSRFCLYIDLNDAPFWKYEDRGDLVSPEELIDDLLGKFAETLEKYE